MSFEQRIESDFNRADRNHDGTIDEGEFRQYLGPVIRDERRLSGTLTPEDVQSFSRDISQTTIYPIGLDVAHAGFTSNPIEYEKFTKTIEREEIHRYGLGPDVGIGAPNLAKKSSQYDPAGAMFDYADCNHDGRIDKQEFTSFIKSV